MFIQFAIKHHGQYDRKTIEIPAQRRMNVAKFEDSFIGLGIQIQVRLLLGFWRMKDLHDCLLKTVNIERLLERPGDP